MSGTEKINSAAAARHVPQAVLDCFWSLSETDREKRITSISKILDAIEKQDKEEAKTTLDYCVDRLVKGLSSSRKQSRRGYATLLTELLHSNNASVDNCISLAEKHFGPFEENDASSAIAWTLLLACLFESGVLINYKNKKFLTTIVSAFTYFGRQKKFVELFLCELLVDGLRYNTISSDLLDSLESSLAGVETSFDLFVKLTIDGQRKTKENKLKATLDLSKVVKLISETTSFLPKFHPLCREVFAHYLINGKFAEFWTSCVNEKLFVPGSKEKNALGFAFIGLVLPQLEKVDVKLVFSQPFLSCLKRCLSNSNNALYNSSVSVMNSVTEALKTTENAQLQVEVCRCFITPPGSVAFDNICKTKFLANAVSSFKKEAVIEWFNILREKVIEMESVGFGDLSRISCVQQIASLIKLPSVGNEVKFQIELIRFLYVYSYFKIRNESKTFKKFMTAITDKLRATFRECFLKCVEFVCLSLTTKQKTHETDALSSITKVVNDSLSDENLEFLLTKTDSKLWRSSVDRLKKLKLDLKNESTFHFSVVYVLFCFHLFEEPEETNDILNELAECIERSSRSDGKALSHSKNDEPHWADVLADLIISMLPTASLSLRKILVSTFQLICGLISEEVIKQLEVALLCEEINANREDESDSDTDMENDENEDEDEESEEEETEDMDVDEQFRLQVATALGPAADCDDNEESDVCLSDSEMFEMDEALAEAFRSRIKSTKLTKQKQLTQLEFKHKCLDLVNSIIVQKNVSMSQLLRVAKLMLDVLHKTPNNRSNEMLMQKSLLNIRSIAAVKRYNVSEVNELKETIVALAKQCLSLCNKVLEEKFQQSLASLFSWIVTIGKQTIDDKQWFVDLIMEALKDTFEKRNSSISTGFFESVVKSHTEVSVPIIKYNQMIAFDQQLRMFKRLEALSILVLCLKSVDNVAAETSLKDPIVEMYRNAIDSLESSITNKKAAYISVLLETILQLQLHLLSPSFVEKMSEQDSALIQSSKEQLLANLSKLDRKIFRSLTVNGKKSLKIIKQKVK